MNGRVRRLEGGQGGADDQATRERLRHYKACMDRYGQLSPKQRAAAARRLADARPTAADRIRAVSAGKDLGLAPPPSNEASRARDERVRQRIEAYEEHRKRRLETEGW